MMKKLLALILVIVLAFSICACNNDDSNDDEKDNDEITLTVDNINEYLTIERTVGNYAASNKVVLRTKSKDHAEFSNATVTIEVKLHAGYLHHWEFETDDSPCPCDDDACRAHIKTITLELDKYGTAYQSEYVELVLESQFSVDAVLDKYSVFYNVVDVTGTVKPED